MINVEHQLHVTRYRVIKKAKLAVFDIFNINPIDEKNSIGI